MWWCPPARRGSTRSSSSTGLRCLKLHSGFPMSTLMPTFLQMGTSLLTSWYWGREIGRQRIYARLKSKTIFLLIFLSQLFSAKCIWKHSFTPHLPIHKHSNAQENSFKLCSKTAESYPDPSSANTLVFADTHNMEHSIFRAGNTWNFFPLLLCVQYYLCVHIYITDLDLCIYFAHIYIYI